MFVLRVLGLQSDRWGSPLPVSRKRWIAIGIAIGAIVSIDMPSKMDSAALPTILAGMLGGAVGAAVLFLAIALVYNSAVARDSARLGRRRVSRGLADPAH